MLAHRMQPRDEDVGPLAAGELEVRHRHVGAAVSKVGRADREDFRRQGLEQVEEHCEVVRRERPQDVLALAHAPRVQTIRVEVLRAAEVAAAQAAPSARGSPGDRA